ncbi:receptor-like serine/threonine-protein kinase SD1-7 isoform X2 [Carica papaya]|uniref:receptor-like serine/threonine-protein kinase SD1-7 isoform X2 n=1 Tax=Carica papaya TaxID=3649 RepID=UPI000B8CD65D|nr:receptor-like serine/threonine-protein kinase SD1-7 isoform X2 [Carica papaya]
MIIYAGARKSSILQMGCDNIMIAFVFFITYSLCIMLYRCEGTMLSGDYITGNKTLVSPTGAFALGFFSPQDSNKSYVGIWYHDLGPEKTVVWVANRDSPLDSPSKFTLRHDNLLILDSTGKIVWSTNITSQHSVNTTVGLLRDDGNLLLQLNEKTVWESFNTSSDTTLPGKIVSFNKKTNKELVLSSWSNKQDPKPGIFTYGIDPEGITQFLIWKKSKRYWRSNVYGLSQTESTYDLWKNMDNFLFTLNFIGDEHYMTFELVSPRQVDKARFLLTSDGQIALFFWLGYEWASIWSAPSRMCDFYGYCGPSGVCDLISQSSSWRVCKCLPGYKPRNEQEWDRGEWSGGCKVEKDLECDNRDGFSKVKMMKFPDLPIMLGMMNASTCQSRCLQNCSCSAYGYLDMPNNKVRDDHVEGRNDIITCLNWHGDLLDLVELLSGDDKGRDLYVRIPGSKSDAVTDGSHENDNHVPIQNKKVVVAISTALIAFLLIAIIALYCLWWRNTSSDRAERNVIGRSFTSEGRQEDGKLVEFNFKSILLATNNFSDSNKLGEGGFGAVYKGNLPQDRVVAIKRLSEKSSQGLEEFMNELKLIANLQHKNLVRLIGCCVKNGEKLLVYEYMPNRSLDKFLFDPNEKRILDWNKRFQIIEGIAQGILYLHKHSRLKVIHRDLKASNILLDGEMNPKISDFEMARIFDMNQTEAKTNKVVGTYGYMSPEYGLYGKFSEKSDVFSFGVLLIEIVSGKRNINFHCEDLSQILQIWAWKEWKKGKALEIIDSSIRDTCSIQQAERCIHIGLLCVQEAPIDRPIMSSVILMLGNETILLPSPKEPAFWMSNDNTSLHQPFNSHSYNEMTITWSEAR